VTHSSLGRLRAARRLLTDATLVRLARFLEFLAAVLPARLVRGLLVLVAASLCTLFWPLMPFRDHSSGPVRDVRPWRWGIFLGDNLASLLGLPKALNVLGWEGERGARESRVGGRGVVVLAGHAGPWEQGARRLAALGLRPLVIVAPWPHLPRSQDVVLGMRARAGVLSATRGTPGWREATAHLRGGGAVVVLVDSASGVPRHRRPLPFVSGDIAAPDAVVSWARRNGAALWVATAEDDGYRLHVLRGAATTAGVPTHSSEVLADRSVSLLRAAILRRPSSWAWIRPLVVLAFGIVLSFSGCSPLEKLPPLPVQPADWSTEAEGLRWSGPLRGDMEGTMQADRFTGRWQSRGANGRFEGVHLSIVRRDEQVELADIQASEANGRWPEGPLVLQDVIWRLQDGLVPSLGPDSLSGSEPELGWSEPGRIECGGCPLERVRWSGGEDESDDVPQP